MIETAFRGPLDEATAEFYIESQIDGAEDHGEAIIRSVLAALKSPRFLYPLLDQDRSISQRVANRLTLTLCDSLPSHPWLLELVAKNGLETEQGIRQAAVRLLDDRRTRAKTHRMMHEWLNLGHFGTISKQSERFPGFDEHLVAELADSLDAFIDETVWSES